MPTATTEVRKSDLKTWPKFLTTLDQPADVADHEDDLRPGCTWVFSTRDGTRYGVYFSLSGFSWYGGALDDNLRPLRRLHPRRDDTLWHGHWTDKGVDFATALASIAFRDNEV